MKVTVLLLLAVSTATFGGSHASGLTEACGCLNDDFSTPYCFNEAGTGFIVPTPVPGGYECQNSIFSELKCVDLIRPLVRQEAPTCTAKPASMKTCKCKNIIGLPTYPNPRCCAPGEANRARCYDGAALIAVKFVLPGFECWNPAFPQPMCGSGGFEYEEPTCTERALFPKPEPQPPKPEPELPKPEPQPPKAETEQPKPATASPKPAPQPQKPAPGLPTSGGPRPKPVPELPEPAPQLPSPTPRRPIPGGPPSKPEPGQPKPEPEQPKPKPGHPEPEPEKPKPEPEQPESEEPEPEQPESEDREPEPEDPEPEQPEPEDPEPEPEPEDTEPEPEQPKLEPEVPETAPQSPGPTYNCTSGSRRYASCYNDMTGSYQHEHRLGFHSELDTFTCPQAYPAGRCCFDPPNKAHGDWGCVAAGTGTLEAPKPAPPPPQPTYYCAQLSHSYKACYSDMTERYQTENSHGSSFQLGSHFQCSEAYPAGRCCQDPENNGCVAATQY